MNSDNFFVISTQRENEGIIFKDYHFGLKRRNMDGSKMWVCTKKSCKASIKTQESSIIKMKYINPDGTHDYEHPPKMSFNVYECIQSIKQRIDKEPTAPVSMLYDEQVKKFRRDYGNAGAIPVFDRVKSSLYEYRSSKQPTIPKTLSSIVVPYSLTRTLTDENFLFCSNVQSIFGFSSLTSLQLLGSNQHWNSDGTFRTAPRLFYQSYRIHIWDDFSMKPVVYAALPNKNFDTYDSLLVELIIYAQNNQITLAPQSILIDFEMAAYKAFLKNFPMANIKGCQFHFGQNIWRQIKKKGLIPYSKGDEARRQIANILSLPLLPPQKIQIAFCDIIEELSGVNARFLKLTDYILRTYIDNAIFPSSFWNVFDLIGIRPRTNNHVEGYHGQLNCHCSTHPNLWAWIRFIQELEESTMVRVDQEQAQQRTTRRRKAKTVINENLLIQAKQEYLDGILDLTGYQKRLRILSYRYIQVFDANEKDDLDYEPKDN
ncbi:unnamed protein product [Adineta ricciae]|uniref:MULE transposase domain-containing protein n=1 Tax=Adineta ricciae TaxID=249248 RepID=A0A815W7M4_ADIRI|nr:unnamed protein product [Adineta ricciae]CAF1565296.1 unnamed protein product [Adineta ricciae]